MLLLGLLATAASAGESEQQPWFVRVAVVAQGDLCQGGVAKIDLSPADLKSLRVPITDPFANDADWDVLPLDPGPYELRAQLVSCVGVPGPLAVLTFDYEEANQQKEIYLGVRYKDGVLDLDYLEVATAWDGSGFFSITRDGENLGVTNISETELTRCAWEDAAVREEFLADGRWDEFEAGGWREWPEDVASLKPGASLVLEPPKVRVIRSGVPPPETHRPSRKRYTVLVQPRRKHFLTLTEPPWSPIGLPTCDRYYLEYPTDENDPSVKVWRRD